MNFLIKGLVINWVAFGSPSTGGRSCMTDDDCSSLTQSNSVCLKLEIEADVTEATPFNYMSSNIFIYLVDSPEGVSGVCGTRTNGSCTADPKLLLEATDDGTIPIQTCQDNMYCQVKNKAGECQLLPEYTADSPSKCINPWPGRNTSVQPFCNSDTSACNVKSCPSQEVAGDTCGICGPKTCGNGTITCDPAASACILTDISHLVPSSTEFNWRTSMTVGMNNFLAGCANLNNDVSCESSRENVSQGMATLAGCDLDHYCEVAVPASSHISIRAFMDNTAKGVCKPLPKKTEPCFNPTPTEATMFPSGLWCAGKTGVLVCTSGCDKAEEYCGFCGSAPTTTTSTSSTSSKSSTSTTQTNQTTKTKPASSSTSTTQKHNSTSGSSGLLMIFSSTLLVVMMGL